MPEQGNQQALPLYPLAEEPWQGYSDRRATAAFSVSHYDTGIRIRFVVEEPYLLALKRPLNGEVHHDNCVEFFIAPDDAGGYYNFEFNCLGSIKAAFGPHRRQRDYLPEQLIRDISDSLALTVSNLGQDRFLRWEIIANIPLQAFTHHPLTSLGNLQCTANFAKCGDTLPSPHFKSWRPIPSATPDFHQPESFGSVLFEPVKDLQSIHQH
ncbi:MAG TPA: carbohydrate-binding family 9-like protein [Chitinophaga sp.]